MIVGNVVFMPDIALNRCLWEGGLSKNKGMTNHILYSGFEICISEAKFLNFSFLTFGPQ
jgi:hypothetical protein